MTRRLFFTILLIALLVVGVTAYLFFDGYFGNIHDPVSQQLQALLNPAK